MRKNDREQQQVVTVCLETELSHSGCVFQELHELINQEQNVIMQTSNALNQCCGSNSTFAGSAEAVECHRLLLVSCQYHCLRAPCVTVTDTCPKLFHHPSSPPNWLSCFC